MGRQSKQSKSKKPRIVQETKTFPDGTLIGENRNMVPDKRLLKVEYRENDWAVLLHLEREQKYWIFSLQVHCG